MEKITSKPRTRTRKVVHEEPLAEFEKELANTVATETPESAPVPCDTPSERSTAMTEMMEQPQVTTGYAVQIGNAGATVKTGMVSSLRGIDGRSKRRSLRWCATPFPTRCGPPAP